MSAYGLLLIQYGVFTLIMVLATSVAYSALWTTDERVFMRNRMMRTWNKQSKVIQAKATESEVSMMFKSAGFPWLTNVRWLLIRVSVLIIGTIYLMATQSMAATLLFVGTWLIGTEPLLKISGIRLLLKFQSESIRRKKESELFSLFALIKTDLMASRSEQINVYHLIREALPYFTSIKPVLVTFLEKWSESPAEAGKVFEKELGSETAQFVGDALAQLHKLPREKAIQLLSEQGKVFVYKRSEMAMQQAEMQRNFFFIFFFISGFAVILWFMWFAYSMSMSSLNF